MSLMVAAVLLAAHSVSAYKRGYRRSPRVVGEEAEVVRLTADDIAATPTAIDWSKKGGTSAINDQGDCGSCWAFSTMETVESAVFMANGALPPPLSVQQLVACDKGADGGCDGGDPVTGVKYLVKNGMDSAADYPDTSSKSGRTGLCKWDKKSIVTVQGSKFAVPECDRGTCTTNEDALAAAVAKYGPLSISINSGDQQACDWMKYKSGVQTKSCSAKANKIDHSVQLVGYDKDASPAYWKVRNSWGKSWGENGFIRLQMGVNSACIGCEALIITAHMKNAPPSPPAPPAPTPPAPPAPTPPAPPSPSCPGGTLQKCIDACPPSPVSVYQACVKACGDRCPAGPTPPVPPAPVPPAPVPPAPVPPAPVPPAPVPGVRQIGCKNKGCSNGCETLTFAIGECVKLVGGGSAKATACSSNGMHSRYWDGSNKCAGLWDDSDWNDIDDCERDQKTDGRVGTPNTFVEFECVGATNATAATAAGGARRSAGGRRRMA